MNIDDLRKVAENATPGPWEAETWEPFGFEGEIGLGVVNHAGWELWDTSGGNCTSSAADAEFIASFNPEMVLALLDRVETAERALQRVRDRHQPCLSCLEPHCFVCEKAKWPCAEFRALEGDE